MRTAVFIPDGVGVRNFLLGTFIHDAASRGTVTAFHRIPDTQLPSYQQKFDDRVSWQRCLKYADGASTFFLRRSISHAHLCYCDTRSMRYARQLPITGSWSKRAMIHAARAYGQLSASPRGIRKLLNRHDRVADKLPEVAQYREIFQKLKPSVLFCTHQRSLEVIPAVLAARQLGIPTSTFIFSWDNLTSKGRFVAQFDHYFVWSDLMRMELLKYYPDVLEENVHVVGTPQFDPYNNDSLLWTREEFCRQLDFDPARPIICYSGGDAGTTPEDQLHAKTLLDLIRQGKIKGNPQVMVRPAPVDFSGRYDQLARDYPEMRFCMPKWLKMESNNWSTVVATDEDVQFLANVTHHADLNVNLASTMTMDFAIHDKPVVNVAFDFANPPLFGVPYLNYYYQFEHYRPVVELGAARIADSPEALAKHVNAYLEDPSLDREGRRKFVELEVSLPLGSACGRIVDVLERISRK
jgi:hypothetical protein